MTSSHFFQESLFNMGNMIPITDELMKEGHTKVHEAFVIDTDRMTQLALSLDKKDQTNVSLPQKEEEQGS